MTEPLTNTQPQKLIIFVILSSVLIAVIVIACIMLKRFYNYSVMMLPANEAPLAAATYFDKNENLYKPFSSKLSKSNMIDITEKIRENKKSIYTHTPPLIYDNLNDLRFQQRKRANDIDPMNSGGTAGRNNRHSHRLISDFEVSERRTGRAQNRPISHQESYYSTCEINSNAAPVMRKKTFGELRKRFLEGTGYKPKDKPVITVETVQPTGSKSTTTGSSSKRTRNNYSENSSIPTDSDEDQIKNNKNLDLDQLKGPGQPTYFRQQALEYALKIDKLLIKINDQDPRLRRNLNVKYRDHFDNIKEITNHFNGRKLYEDKLLRVPYKLVYNISNHLDNIRFGSDIYTFEKLEETKRLVDVFCNEVIEKSSIPGLGKYYRKMD